jgi:hypothetical protein
MTKLVGTAVYNRMTMRSENTVRRLLDLMTP